MGVAGVYSVFRLCMLRCRFKEIPFWVVVVVVFWGGGGGGGGLLTRSECTWRCELALIMF